MKVKDGKCVHEFLGMIPSWIVNRQYYTYKIKANEKIHFEQHPISKFGSDVMEAFNSNGWPVGHLAADSASYIRPLVAKGIIYVEGNTIPVEKNEIIAVSLYVRLIKNNSFLRPKRTRNAESILHNHILSAYLNKERYSDKTIIKLGDYYYTVMKGKDIYPETKLLYYLTPFKSFLDRRIDPMIDKMKKKRNAKSQ